MPPQFLIRNQRALAATVALAAALRVFLCAAAFPFFTNIDEQYHFDAIVQYANGYRLQPELPRFQPASADMIALYYSNEFGARPDLSIPSPQGWCHPTQESLAQPTPLSTHWRGEFDDEVLAPPVYYVVAAAWYRLGGWLGYSGLLHLYWTRLLQALAYGCFVYLGFWFVRKCYPGNYYLHAALPLFLLVFPQDIFFSLNPNAVFPVFMAAALCALALIVADAKRSYWVWTGAGLLVAATSLAGYGNIVVLIPLTYCLYILYRRPDWRNRRTRISALLAAALAPPFLWAVRNRIILEDWTGSIQRERLMGWTRKPLSQILPHPIFSLDGFAYFISALLRNFWRGEIVWRRSTVTSWIDPFYLWSSVILGVVFFVFLLRRRDAGPDLEKFADRSSGLIVGASVLFLIALSLRFDFGSCWYPSRAKPYFVSGRLIIGALLPFAIAYLRGIQILIDRIKITRINAFAIVVILVLVIAITETLNLRPVFASQDNLFALLLGSGCGH